MAEARESSAWGRASLAIFFLSEMRRLACDPKHAPKPLQLSDINPYIKKEKPLPVSITALKSLIKKRK